MVVTDSNRLRWWILHRYPTYARGCLLSALFLVPIAVHFGVQDQFQLPKLSVLWLLGVMALGLLIAWSAESRTRLPRPRLAYATVAFVSACVLATALSQAPLISLVGIEERYGGVDVPDRIRLWIDTASNGTGHDRRSGGFGCRASLATTTRFGWNRFVNREFETTDEHI